MFQDKTLKMMLGLMCVLLLGACNTHLKPFTEGMLKDNQWTENELKRIQFYLSEDIILRRQLTEGSTEIVSGKIKIERGEQIEEIRIKRGTPGVFLFKPKDNNFAIGFDSRSDKRYLTFGPNPKKQGQYVLLGSEWKDRQGKVRYDNTYYFVNPDAVYAQILVDIRKIRRVEVSSQEAPGRKVE